MKLSIYDFFGKQINKNLWTYFVDLYTLTENFNFIQFHVDRTLTYQEGSYFDPLLTT